MLKRLTDVHPHVRHAANPDRPGLSHLVRMRVRSYGVTVWDILNEVRGK